MQGYSNGLPLSRDHLVFVYVYNNYISIHVGDCYVLVNSDVITTCPVEDHLILVMKTSVCFRCQTVLFYLLCTSSMWRTFCFALNSALNKSENRFFYGTFSGFRLCV